MHIETPDSIESVLWEGELEAPSVVYSLRSSDRPKVTIGEPAIWKAEDALEIQTGHKWVPPMGDAEYFLVRLTCTLRKPQGRAACVEARQELKLRPQEFDASPQSAYAFDLYPERLGVEDKVNRTVQLSPGLKFSSGAQFNAGQVGASIEYKKVFPVIQAYGVGESRPYWEFKKHKSFPLEGSQSVLAVIACGPESRGAWARVDLTVTVESAFGPIRYGTTRESASARSFKIP